MVIRQCGELISVPVARPCPPPPDSGMVAAAGYLPRNSYTTRRDTTCSRALGQPQLSIQCSAFMATTFTRWEAKSIACYAARMIAWAKYQRILWRLERAKRETVKSYSKHFREAADKDYQERFDILNDEQEELRLIDDEIAETISYYVLSKAQKLTVPTPNYSEEGAWVTSHRTGLPRLSEKALAEIQSAARNKQKERLQLWGLRIKVFAPVLAGLTGTIGALIGLVAILKR